MSQIEWDTKEIWETLFLFHRWRYRYPDSSNEFFYFVIFLNHDDENRLKKKPINKLVKFHLLPDFQVCKDFEIALMISISSKRTLFLVFEAGLQLFAVSEEICHETNKQTKTKKAFLVKEMEFNSEKEKQSRKQIFFKYRVDDNDVSLVCKINAEFWDNKNQILKVKYCYYYCCCVILIVQE